MDADAEELKQAIKFYLECEKHDPGGVLRRFLPMYNIADALQSQGLPEEQYKGKITAVFVSILQVWVDENPNYVITDDDLFWLGLVTTHLGVGGIMGPGLLKWMLNYDQQGVLDNLNKMREKGELPANISNIEYLENVLDPPILKLPPQHPFWQSLGVSNSSEWNQLGAEKVILLSTRIKQTSSVFIKTLKREYERRGKSEKSEYTSEDKSRLTKRALNGSRRIVNVGIEPAAEDKIKYISDSDRLSQFYELAGIPMDLLTDGEVRRILDLFVADEGGYGLASKKGVSLTAYYGDQADS